MLQVRRSTALGKCLSQVAAVGGKVFGDCGKLGSCGRWFNCFAPAVEQVDGRRRPEFASSRCAQLPRQCPLWHHLESCGKSSLSGIIIRLPFISFSPDITWRLTKRPFAHLEANYILLHAISHTLLDSGNENPKLSSDLKLLAWQPARRCHQPQCRRFSSLSADGMVYWSTL